MTVRGFDSAFFSVGPVLLGL